MDPNPQHHHAPRHSPLPRSSKPQKTDSKTLTPSDIAPGTQQKPQLSTHAMTSMADATTHAKTCRKRQETGLLGARCDAVPEWRWCKLGRFRRGFGCEWIARKLAPGKLGYLSLSPSLCIRISLSLSPHYCLSLSESICLSLSQVLSAIFVTDLCFWLT